MRRMATFLRIAMMVVLLVGGAVAADGRGGATGEDERPRIGLALGGGGARGAAHVGVLRVLEDLQVPVDYVAGTSMGSIVGALYALGLSADEIERELLWVDWADLFVDRPPREQRRMRRKQDDQATFFPIELGLRGGWFATPRGLIAGQKFAFAFPERGLITAGHRSFDDLPIPYRAVATDLESGEKVVLDRGNLIQAVRASMSIPGVFPPVERDGRLLVDGFLTSNVPVDVVRAMGADIVIAVEVGRRMEDMTREELATLGGIQEQAARIRTQLALADELARADIVIRPELERWTGQEYDRLAEIMPPGEQAAQLRADELAALSIATPQYRMWRNRVSTREYPRPVVERLELVNETRILDEVIRDRLNVTAGAPFSRTDLRAGLEEIYELGVVERSEFTLDRGTLEVRVTEKPYAPWVVHIGGSYRMSYTGISPFMAHVRLNRMEVNRFGAEWRTDLTVGSVLGGHSEFYQPLGLARQWFVAPFLHASLRDDGLFVDDLFIGDYQYRRLELGVDVGRAVGRSLELRAGLVGGQHATEWTNGLLRVPKLHDEFLAVRTGLTFDSLDDHRLPAHGVKGEIRLLSPQPWLGSDVQYDRLWGQFLVAVGGDRNTVLLDIEGGTDLGSDPPYYQHFYLGGLRSLSGYQIDRLRGTSFGLASVGWLHRLAGGALPFATRSYLGLWLDAGNVWFDEQDVGLDDMIYNAAISLLLETPLGPLHIGYGRADDGNDAVHLDFGVHLGSPVN
ncbi:BamA/TamA family outer membrane protein [bacterium]|nr:BamA/TamA family outer membrane protein [bacterium]